MRTKTLLIAAAALAAAVTSSQAQTVYSQNVVGYVNSTLSGSGAFTMVNNPLNGTTNGAEQILPGLNPNGGETVFIWTGSGYFLYVWQGPGAGTQVNGVGNPGFQSDWSDGSATPTSGHPVIPNDQTDTSDNLYWAPQPIINPGQGFFLENPNSTETNTFTGTVETTNNTTIKGSGAFNLVASAIPVAGDAETNTVLNLANSFNSNGGETVFVWTGSGYFLYVWQGPGAGTQVNGVGQPGFQSDWSDGSATPTSGHPVIPGDQTDTSDNLYWTPALQLSVGQGFFVENPNSTETWSQTITNIP